MPRTPAISVPTSGSATEPQSLARMSRDESDRVLRLARVFTLAMQVFGDREKAWHWLWQPKWLFDGRAPLDLLDTAAGACEIEEELIRIDEGMFI